MYRRFVQGLLHLHVLLIHVCVVGSAQLCISNGQMLHIKFNTPQLTSPPKKELDGRGHF